MFFKEDYYMNNERRHTLFMESRHINDIIIQIGNSFEEIKNNETKRECVKNEIQSAYDAVTGVYDEESMCYDNIPENLMYSMRAEIMSDNVDALDDCISDIDDALSSIDDNEIEDVVNSLKSAIDNMDLVQ